MKKIGVSFASLVLFLGLLVPTVQLAVAQEDPDRPTSSEDTPPLPPEANSEDVTVQSRANSRDSRIAAYKERTGEVLTEPRRQRYLAQCNSAQTRTATLQANIETVQSNRLSLYNRINERLNNLELQLEKAAVDTASYTEAFAEIKLVIEQAKVDLEAFSLTLSDLAVLDCEDDPEAFHAALLTARQFRVDLVSNSENLVQQLRQEMIPLLQSLREELLSGATNQ